MGYINNAEFDVVFGTGEHLAVVIGLHGCEFVRAVDWFVVEDAVEFKGEFERRNIDVEFTVNGIFAVEVKFERGVESGKFGGEPDFEFGDAGALGLMGVIVFGGTGLTTEMVLGLFELGVYFGNGLFAVCTYAMDTGFVVIQA